MSGAGRPLVALAMAGTFLMMPLTAFAVDDGTQVLPGQTAGAITIDVDGDGVREVVRVVPEPSRARYLLEAWAFDGDRWALIGTANIVRHNQDHNARVPINSSADAFGLLAWNDGNGERLLLATVGNAVDGDTGCCLTVSAVAMSDGVLRVYPLVGTFGDAELIFVLDVDGDGVDELLVSETAPGDQPATARLLRWNGESGFDSQPVELPAGTGPWFGWVIGDSDGVPGEELISGPTSDGQLVRFVAEPGALLVAELARGVPGAFGRPASPFGAAGGMVMGMTQDEIHVMDWPRGGEIEVIHRQQTSERFAMSVVGTGTDAVIVDYGHGPNTDEGPQEALVYDPTLEPQLSLPPSDASSRLSELSARGFPALRLVPHGLFPYVGPLPGGMGDGREAFFAAGSLVILGGEGEPAVRPTNGLVGRLPVGVAGPDHGWMALAAGYFVGRDWAFLRPHGFSGSLAIAPITEVLPDEPPDGRLRPELRDAIVIEDADGTQRVFAPDGGFTATISAPPLSSVVVAFDHTIPFQGEMGLEPMSIEVGPATQREGDQDFKAAIVVITPAGAAYTVAWEGRILREPPELAAAAQTNLLQLSATVSGVASPETAVTIDGEPVATDARGRFSLSVDAAIWPRDVVVTASNALGNQSQERLSVVGVVDYRGLPWVPIVAFATIGIGAALFVRTPGQHSRSLARADDAHLEEIE